MLNVRRQAFGQLPRNVFCAAVVMLTCTGPTFAFDVSDSDFERKYEKLTIQLLLMGLDFEQYSLNYRMEALRDPRSKRTRYFVGQETSAAGAMTAAIIASDQTYKVIHHPDKVSTHALRNFQTTGEVTSIIGAASSGLELGSNSLHALKDKINHSDPKNATAYLKQKLSEIDKGLAERQALITSRSDFSPARMAQYKAESKLLNIMRDVIVNEHKRFEVSKSGFRAQENVFYLLNIGSSIVSALQFKYGYKSVRYSGFSGTSNLCSTIAAAMVQVNPVFASISSRVMRQRTQKTMDRELGVVNKPPSVEELKQGVVELQNAAVQTKNDQSCQFTAEAILDAYGAVNQIFPRELESEIALLHTLDQVAVQNIYTSQPIGGCALASGITGTLAYYKYRHNPKVASHLNLTSSLTGLTGTSLATGLTGLGYLYETLNLHHLRSEGRLPEQLMQERITASKNVSARLIKNAPL